MNYVLKRSLVETTWRCTWSSRWVKALLTTLLTTVNWAQLSNRRYVDTDMLPGSYPHRKYIICMLGNLIKRRWEEMLPMRDEQQTSEDRATQPLEAGGWISQLIAIIQKVKWNSIPFFKIRHLYPFQIKMSCAAARVLVISRYQIQIHLLRDVLFLSHLLDSYCWSVLHCTVSHQTSYAKTTNIGTMNNSWGEAVTNTNC